MKSTVLPEFVQTLPVKYRVQEIDYPLEIENIVNSPSLVNWPDRYVFFTNPLNFVKCELVASCMFRKLYEKGFLDKLKDSSLKNNLRKPVLFRTADELVSDTLGGSSGNKPMLDDSKVVWLHMIDGVSLANQKIIGNFIMSRVLNDTPAMIVTTVTPIVKWETIFDVSLRTALYRLKPIPLFTK